MNENQIDYFIHHNLKRLRNRNFHAYYRGCFASDELSHSRLRIKHIKKPQCFGFIFNTLKRYESTKMGHWLAIVIKIMPELVKLKFFDSFNKSYTFYGEHISNYINKIRTQAIRNNSSFELETSPFILQYIDSKICGGYVIYTILNLEKCNQTTLKQVYETFKKKNKKKNDSKIMKYISMKWPTNQCSNILNNSNGVSFCPVKVYDHHRCLSKCLCGEKCCTKQKSNEYIRATLAKSLHLN